jgi:hypothetical protein
MIRHSHCGMGPPKNRSPAAYCPAIASNLRSTARATLRAIAIVSAPAIRTRGLVGSEQ